MSEANDGPGETTVIVVPAGEGPALAIGEGGDVQAVGETAAEPIVEAAVAIAEIEAERDVTLAVIHQEGEAEWAARRNSEEVNECRETIARLEGQLEALRNPPSPPLILAPLVAEPLSPPPPPSESTAEDGPRESLADPVEVAEAQAPEPPPKAKPRHRWI